MNKDQVKGELNDIKGRVKRQTGEWTGDEESQTEGTVDQVKGKAQKAWGDLKDGAEKAKDDFEKKRKEDDAA